MKTDVIFIQSLKDLYFKNKVSFEIIFKEQNIIKFLKILESKIK